MYDILRMYRHVTNSYNVCVSSESMIRHDMYCCLDNAYVPMPWDGKSIRYDVHVSKGFH